MTYRRCAPFAKEKLNLLRVYNAASAFGKRPSEFFAFETEIGAWLFDEACLSVGRRVENNVNNGKDPFEGFSQVSGVRSQVSGYRSVKGTRPMKKVKIKADGTW